MGSKASFYWAAAPEGSMTYAFTHMGNFSPSLSPPPLPGSGPLGWDLDLEAEIWASRLGFELRRGGIRRRNFPMCESIGHRPLRGRCPAPSISSTTNLGRAPSNAFATFTRGLAILCEALFIHLSVRSSVGL